MILRFLGTRGEIEPRSTLRGDAKLAAARIEALGRERGVRAAIARDGWSCAWVETGPRG